MTIFFTRLTSLLGKYLDPPNLLLNYCSFFPFKNPCHRPLMGKICLELVSLSYAYTITKRYKSTKSVNYFLLLMFREMLVGAETGNVVQLRHLSVNV